MSVLQLLVLPVLQLVVRSRAAVLPVLHLLVLSVLQLQGEHELLLLPVGTASHCSLSPDSLATSTACTAEQIEPGPRDVPPRTLDDVRTLAGAGLLQHHVR